ncbi:DUF2235 domain-containing protein [Piscinibacter sakaiensis]|uniref:Conserved domain protein n=1 Tax=Piscinibacter sakaiensis TaxID=1547922 RepID=A0A0K8P110_PISS1|nr:DUF2235 domain-containing protein [Piscinibacter sakaiensis]GAP36219.1 conserved domain protein [Piscinibacter sakaiensis]
MSISLPLDSTACGQADDVFYCAHQGEPGLFDASGARVPLSADDPAQQALRDHWCALYEDILAHHRDGSRPFPSCGWPGHVHHDPACRHCLVSTLPSDAGEPAEDDPGDTDPIDPVKECPCQEEGPPRIRLRYSLFFDGTGNNRDNVSAGNGPGTSYSAGYTNVARLEWAQFEADPSYDEHASIYTEGVGTVTGGADVPLAQATGVGTAGLKAKVAAARDALLERIRAAAGSTDTVIECIHLDSLGFSRGAASARHFIHVALVDARSAIQPCLQAEGYTVGEVAVKFCGLYDTVAAFGAAHANDTWELSLDAIRHADTVVQLAAAEEHRANFSLTNIDSAGSGRELFLPGVHSDVGGGYAPGCSETDVQLFDVDLVTGVPIPIPLARRALQREWDWLIDAGWFTESELRCDMEFQIFGTRGPISDLYARIPLHLMAEYARDAGLAFTGAVEAQHPIPAALQTAEQEIRAAIADGRCHAPDAWFGHAPAGDPDWLKALRHDHLHFSSLYGVAASYGAMHPRFSVSAVVGWRERRILPG